jgi:DNA-binding MarR family transcriptional regulator
MFLTLDLLDAADVKNQQEIADHLGLTKAAVSRHITTARNRGWLSSEPSSGSRRENTVALTSAGQDLVQRGRRYRSIAERRAAEELGAEDLLRTAKTLDRLSADLEQRLRAEA